MANVQMNALQAAFQNARNPKAANRGELNARLIAHQGMQSRDGQFANLPHGTLPTSPTAHPFPTTGGPTMTPPPGMGDGMEAKNLSNAAAYWKMQHGKQGQQFGAMGEAAGKFQNSLQQGIAGLQQGNTGQFQQSLQQGIDGLRTDIQAGMPQQIPNWQGPTPTPQPIPNWQGQTPDPQPMPYRPQATPGQMPQTGGAQAPWGAQGAPQPIPNWHGQTPTPQPIPNWHGATPTPHPMPYRPQATPGGKWSQQANSQKAFIQEALRQGHSPEMVMQFLRNKLNLK